MIDYLSALAATPWIWAVGVLLIVSLAIWIGSITVVLRSTKFLRKPLWILLTFFTFTFQWSAGPNTMAVGLPFGALYVLGFWRWGMWPTEEERAARIIQASPAVANGRAVTTLRIAYGSLAAAFAVMMAWTVFGPVMSMMGLAAGAGPEEAHAFRLSMVAFGLLFLGFFVFLAVRPYPLAKLLCGLCALAWLGHGLISLIVMPLALGPGFPTLAHAAVTGGAGLVAAACGIVHHRLDRRMSGTYLRAA